MTCPASSEARRAAFDRPPTLLRMRLWQQSGNCSGRTLSQAPRTDSSTVAPSTDGRVWSQASWVFPFGLLCNERANRVWYGYRRIAATPDVFSFRVRLRAYRAFMEIILIEIGS